MKNRKILQDSLTTKYFLTKIEKEEILEILQTKKIIIDFDKESTLLSYLSGEEDEVKIKEIMLNIEKYEYNKSNTYFILYDYFLTKEELLQKIKNKNNIFNNNDLDLLSTKYEKPKIVIDENKIQFKFSKVHTSANKKLKHPITIEFFTKECLFQVKFDKIEEEYHIKGKNMIIDVILKIEDWLTKVFELNYNENSSFKNMTKIIEDINSNEIKDKNITEYIDYGTDSLAGDVKLKANSRDKMPIYSELRILKEKMKCEEDKNEVESLIKKLDKSIERYKRGIECVWEKGSRKSRIQVALNANYIDTKKTLGHMYNNHQSVERRDYVIKFIGKYPQIGEIKKPN